LQGLQARRDTLLSLQRSAPALERQLSQAEAELRIAEEQQSLLVGLLAGRDKVQTFLALLNQQAMASGVQIQRYEPLKTPPPQQGQSRQNNRRSKAKQKAETQQDPLQALGYRKSSVALEVSGPFWGLQTFLQQMEALEMWVESSELALKAVTESNGEVQPSAVSTQITLRLSFYDLAPVVPSSAEGSISTSS
jgi:type IV pilus assembly protein PilO